MRFQGTLEPVLREAPQACSDLAVETTLASDAAPRPLAGLAPMPVMFSASMPSMSNSTLVSLRPTRSVLSPTLSVVCCATGVLRPALNCGSRVRSRFALSPRWLRARSAHQRRGSPCVLRRGETPAEADPFALDADLDWLLAQDGVEHRQACERDVEPWARY